MGTSTLLNRRRLAIIGAFTLVATFLMMQRGTDVTADASAGVPIYLTCTGAKQGPIKGDTTTKGLEGYLALTAVSESINSPRDPATGQATGRTVHKPISFTMVVDKATPKLINSLVTNENLTSCMFKFFKPGPNGTRINYFNIGLTNSNVISEDFAGRQSNSDTVTFSLTYQHIVYTFVPGNVVASDDWQAPVT